MLRVLSVASIAGMLLTSGVLTSVSIASDSGPVIVVPGRADVPVVYYGRDISGAVVEGDWGLARPGNVELTVIYPYAYPRRAYDGPPPRGFFPSMGTEPRVGRREAPIDRRPRPPQDYNHSWSSQSAPTPATAPSPYERSADVARAAG